MFLVGSQGTRISSLESTNHLFSPRKMGISLNPDFDTIVIGAGLFGSACAKHIGLLTGDTKRICLIGPEEPQDRADTNVCQNEI